MSFGVHRFASCALPLSVLLTGCGGSTRGSPSTSQATGGSAGAAWPQQIVLHRTTTGLEGEGLRLADATVLGSGVAGADLRMHQSKVASLSSPESFCEKGKFDSLAEVPVDDVCQGGSWTSGIQLSGASIHSNEESLFIGLSALVKDAAHSNTYRLRILGDAYDAQGSSSVTFDYEPVP